jgi:hypothetical protein
VDVQHRTELARNYGAGSLGISAAAEANNQESRLATAMVCCRTSASRRCRPLNAATRFSGCSVPLTNLNAVARVDVNVHRLGPHGSRVVGAELIPADRQFWFDAKKDCVRSPMLLTVICILRNSPCAVTVSNSLLGSPAVLDRSTDVTTNANLPSRASCPMPDIEGAAAGAAGACPDVGDEGALDVCLSLFCPRAMRTTIMPTIA